MASKNKSNFHPRNKYKGHYDFKSLIIACPELNRYVKPTEQGQLSIDFANPKAVRWLNRALLRKDYKVQDWTVPKDYLCPPIPGRADYIHHLADLIEASREEMGDLKVKILDVGVGASCIYPLIGVAEYGWKFVGSDVDEIALKNATAIIANNKLGKKIVLRHQKNANVLLQGIVKPDEYFNAVMCNPPFFATAEEALSATERKNSQLKNRPADKTIRNFGGQANELYCEGGEKVFIRKLIDESEQFQSQILWFTTLVSQEAHLAYFKLRIRRTPATETRVIDMGTGNKKTRILAWRF